MSSLIAKNVQIGADTTATNNFTIYQPATPNGTLLIGNGNTGITSSLVTLTSAGNLGIGGTSASKFTLGGASDQSIQINGSGTAAFVGTSTAVAQISSNRNPTTGAIYDAGRAVSYINLEASNGNGNIQFYTTATNNVNATERMRLDSSGNLGLGVTPTVRLQVKGPDNASGTIARFSSLNEAANLALTYDSIFTDGVLRFYTGGLTVGTATERVRLDSSGNLLVGTTSATIGGSAGIRSLPAGDGANLPIFAVSTTGSTSATAPLQIYAVGTGYRFYVSANGQISATITTISAISDARFKENVRDLDAGLTEVMALKPRLYDWKEGKGADIKNARGFIAQEFEQVFPDLIDEWKDPAPEGEEPYKSVRQDLIPVLVKAIQEQQALIATLQADVAALKAAA